MKIILEYENLKSIGVEANVVHVPRVGENIKIDKGIFKEKYSEMLHYAKEVNSDGSIVVEVKSVWHVLTLDCQKIIVSFL